MRIASRGHSPSSAADESPRRLARNHSKDEDALLPENVPLHGTKAGQDGPEESFPNRAATKIDNKQITQDPSSFSKSSVGPPFLSEITQGRARQDTGFDSAETQNGDNDTNNGDYSQGLNIAKARASAAAAAAAAMHNKRVMDKDKQNRGEEFRAALNLPSISQEQTSRVGGNSSSPSIGGERPMSLPPSALVRNHVLPRPPSRVSAGGQNEIDPSLNELGRGIHVALTFLDASDRDIRLHSGEAIAQLLKDCGRRDIHNASSQGTGGQQKATFAELTMDEMSALKVLATSRASSLRRVAAEVLGEYSSRSGIPRGKTTLRSFLKDATDLVKSSECALQIFAVRVAIDFASKGTIWQKRLVEMHWFQLIVAVVSKTLQDATTTRRLHPHRTDSPTPADDAGVASGTDPSGATSVSTGLDADDVADGDGEGDGDASSSRNVGQTEIVLNFSEEQRRLLKLAFEFIGKLDLDDVEKSMKQGNRSDLLGEIREGRKKLINLLTDMCMGSSLHVHVSLLKLLFNAFGGLVRNLTKDHWQDGLEEQFIERALGIILERAEEAAHQHQSLVSAILSQSMMQGDADDMIPDMYDEAYEDGASHLQATEMLNGLASPMTPSTPSAMPGIVGFSQPGLGTSPATQAAATEATAALTQLQLAQQQMYRQTSSLTSSTLSYMSLGGFRNGGGGGGGGGGGMAGTPAAVAGTPRPSVLAAELAANESRWAQSQRNAQQSNQLLVKKLHLVALTMGALEVVQHACVSSRAIANATVELFEMRGVMRVLNMLYRSDVPGAKAQIAQFLCTLCENVSDRHKVQLCESGVIVRLLRLASPSSVYGKKSPGGLASSDEAAFVPSIKAITSLAQVDVIGARIVIAGGVGPLYSHANSTRDSRMAAKEALEVLGVGNLNDLVEVWTAHRRKGAFRELRDDEYVVEDKQVDEEEDDDHPVVDPQPLIPSSHRRSIRKPEEDGGSSLNRRSSTAAALAAKANARNGGKRGDRRRNLLLSQRSNSINSTRSFYEPSQAQTPRVQRVVNLLTKWRRTDGSSLMVRLDSLRGDPSGSRPFHNDVILGSGAFSTVYKAFMVRDDMTQEDPDDTDGGGGSSSGSEDAQPRYIPVAVKRLTDAAFADNSFLDEIKIMSKLPAHGNICNLHAVAMAENTAYIISELGGPHTLAHHLASARSENPEAVSPLCKSWVARLKVAIGISEALKALQSLNPIIVHLDLKSSNVLLTDLGGGRYVPKLCDFGLAIELKAGLEFLSPANHGTLQYMAPEVLRNEEVELSKGFDQAADTYSFAIVLWDMAHPGRVPWDELAVDTELDSIQDRIREMVLSQRRPTRFSTEHWPKGYERLMRSCWRHKPEDRPPFVRSFLTDPDSLTFASSKSKDGDVAQETIGTTLKRIMWDYKSARRVRRGRHDAFEDTSNDDFVRSVRESDKNRGSIDHTTDGLQESPARSRRPTRLRRQSSVLTHRHLPPEMVIDYHDHDDESHAVHPMHDSSGNGGGVGSAFSKASIVGSPLPLSPVLSQGGLYSAEESPGGTRLQGTQSVTDLRDALGQAGSNNDRIGGSMRDVSIGNSFTGSTRSLTYGESRGSLFRLPGSDFASGRVTPPARRVFRRHVSNSVDESSLTSNSSRRLNLV
ncbi:Protein kinase, putative [Hondaea fermentalgiana]|uniref:Protein kinase, putative n=1 Tax=Hondaea fermentalgiana TaxID=2315210 RepID=A0A2R5G4A5_9STRA|nr:Protein kinase, putative [Hondaea fermentalgiana]|eukprot:GBG25862.1 Protein kinase, putative [Hondaea fermentalgiana]